MISRNASSAFIRLLDALLHYADTVPARGNTMTKELIAHSLDIEHPLQRVYMLPHRNDNIFAKIAETLWVVSGRNDIAWLSEYLPRAAEYSDDGLTWRAGYGPRLRNYHGVDQLKECVRLLNTDRSTRRAVMSLFDPTLDFVESKDIPCNNWIQFIIRNDVLHMNVTQRSSDVWFGFSGINTFEWSVIHEMMAYWTQSVVGPLHYFIGSLHIYEKHWERAKKVLVFPCAAEIYDLPLHVHEFSTAFDDLDLVLDRLFCEVHAMDEPGYQWPMVEGDSMLSEFMRMLWVYKMIQKDPSVAAYILEHMDTSDLKLAGLEYLYRSHKYLYENSNISPMEIHILSQHSSLWK